MLVLKLKSLQFSSRGSAPHPAGAGRPRPRQPISGRTSPSPWVPRHAPEALAFSMRTFGLFHVWGECRLPPLASTGLPRLFHALFSELSRNNILALQTLNGPSLDSHPTPYQYTPPQSPACSIHLLSMLSASARNTLLRSATIAATSGEGV